MSRIISRKALKGLDQVGKQDHMISNTKHTHLWQLGKKLACFASIKLGWAMFSSLRPSTLSANLRWLRNASAKCLSRTLFSHEKILRKFFFFSSSSAFYWEMEMTKWAMQQAMWKAMPHQVASTCSWFITQGYCSKLQRCFLAAGSNLTPTLLWSHGKKPDAQKRQNHRLRIWEFELSHFINFTSGCTQASSVRVWWVFSVQQKFLPLRNTRKKRFFMHGNCWPSKSLPGFVDVSQRLWEDDRLDCPAFVQVNTCLLWAKSQFHSNVCTSESVPKILTRQLPLDWEKQILACKCVNQLTSSATGTHWTKPLQILRGFVAVGLLCFRLVTFPCPPIQLESHPPHQVHKGFSAASPGSSKRFRGFSRGLTPHLPRRFLQNSAVLATFF